RTGEATLYEKLPDSRVRCYACGHRCLVLDGFRGICKVRFNRDGILYAPRNYVGPLQCDPTEKKPFFHLLPGSDTLTFGMLGCDFHCGYCFTGDTIVTTDSGPREMVELFHSANRVQPAPEAEIAYPDGVRVVAASGHLRRLRAVFKHAYKGPMTTIRP